ncbi:hypothetical protein TNIN_478921 [Trichonephila inaurata madagascariensis]|uniref:Uncharacterized protein n=1 Tax=Trichonephila inaurata madagascariensis TaxID=2747483 RepID=A0A8X6X1S3_9ARAC|nr:hypothetical protein TNIN_478921 [Trichonephila inaurata madagascariensis]
MGDFTNSEKADLHLMYSNVNGYGTAVLRLYQERFPSFFIVLIVAKWQEINCGTIEISEPSCRNVDIDRVRTSFSKWSTLHRTRLPTPDLWPISISPVRNIANNLRTIYSLSCLVPVLC